MLTSFEQYINHFKTVAMVLARFFAPWVYVLLPAIGGVDPVCVGYAVVAAVLFYRAWRFYKAGKIEHMEDCAIHGIRAALIAFVHEL